MPFALFLAVITSPACVYNFALYEAYWDVLGLTVIVLGIFHTIPYVCFAFSKHNKYKHVTN